MRLLLSLAFALLVGVVLSGCGMTPSKTGASSLAPGGATLSLSGTSFDFGQVVVPQTATRDVVTVTNSGTANAALTVAVQGDPTLTLDPALSCGASLAPGGSCTIAVSFAPATSGKISGSLTISPSGGTSQNVSLTGTGEQLSGGESLVTATQNPVVALYSWQAPSQGNVSVQFGATTSYGFTTSAATTPANGGPVSILVAGMKQNTAYHMRAVLTESDGTVVDDQDHTFTTTSFPSSLQPQVTTTTASGMTPQSGIEMVNASSIAPNNKTTTTYLGAYALDLSGNLIWGYQPPDLPSKYTIIQPLKLLPNGNLLMVLSFASQYVLPGQGVTLTPGEESVDLIREIDLAGDPVAQITLDQLNAKLANAGYSNMTLTDLHHDVTMLPNGHIILIANMLKSYSNLTGISGSTNVLGDVLVDLDPNFNVSWVWSTFDHLDVNHHPIGFPDWTHTNAVFYSPVDGDLLISMRHQDWIIKIAYENGAGNGDVLWKLGNGGDFTLSGGTAPQDWFYGQHDPSFVGGATSGQFSLAMMDNGYGRMLADGSQCTSSGSACYTTAPVVAINESAKTANITFRQMVPASQFAIWGGNAEVLANGDMEYDLCSEADGSEVDEVTTTGSPQAVWTMKETGENLYRAMRIPSLYPGVQW
ncbi:MAG TPA: aryl-sulfate sulfotransferase [Acidobacteriaceae bacterium]|nr:aryl-sulfate sulfotransferase [Acidobacteriaceae bacterium]